jgi:hypothetical protein
MPGPTLLGRLDRVARGGDHRRVRRLDPPPKVENANQAPGSQDQQYQERLHPVDRAYYNRTKPDEVSWPSVAPARRRPFAGAARD